MALAGVLRRCRLPIAVFLFLGVGGLTVAPVLRRPMSDRFADLHMYLGAVSAVRHGMPLYDYAAANGDRFTYPPRASD